MSKIRVRYPPSPTGFCHVGTARMAILNYLFAKKNGGTIFFRSEDTDKERSKIEYEEDIKEQLHWLGLSWDEFTRTSELVSVHTAAMQKLVDEGKAYISTEESKKEPGKTVSVVRLRNPGKKIVFTDVIRGEISFDTTELGDFAIGRAIDDPLFHLAVVVDDATQGITHVIRGEDHISNTPRQILIQEALGYPRPVYAHYPLHLGADKSKLSKRTGDVAVKSYREKGFLPVALLNYIAILGWTPPSGREILTLEEMIEEFDLKDIHKSGAVFDIEKLRWYNREYLRMLPENEYDGAALATLKSSVEARNIAWDETIARKILPVLKERINVWDDIRVFSEEGELDYFFGDPSVDPAKVPGKGSDRETAKKHLEALGNLLRALPSSHEMTSDEVKQAVWEYAEREGRGKVLWPMRYALSGKEKSPDPFKISSIIGKENVLRRLESAEAML